MTRSKKAIKNDLYWARHIRVHGQTPAQRERGRRREERFSAELAEAEKAETEKSDGLQP